MDPHEADNSAAIGANARPIKREEVAVQREVWYKSQTSGMFKTHIVKKEIIEEGGKQYISLEGKSHARIEAVYIEEQGSAMNVDPDPEIAPSTEDMQLIFVTWLSSLFDEAKQKEISAAGLLYRKVF